MLNFISIGDVTEDVFIQCKDMTVKYFPDIHMKMLMLRYSDKIAAERVDKLLGGNAGNAAIGSRRLGLKSALWATVGDDDQGRMILRSLKDNKVSTKYFNLAKGEKTNYSVVINYGPERTILVHHEPRKYKPKPLEKAEWVYVTSAAAGSERLWPSVHAHKKKYNSKIGFNPGTHQFTLKLNGLKKMLGASTVTSLNVEETMLIFKQKERNIRKLLTLLKDTGMEIAVVTDGHEGSYMYDGNEYYFCPIYDVPIIERTGCGDSFTTGFITALAYGKSPVEAMRWGTVNAAGVIQHIGPQEGLLKLPFLKKVLKAHPKFQPRVFKGKDVTTNTKYIPKTIKKW